MSAKPSGIDITHGAVDLRLLPAHGFCARARRRSDFADPALTAYFLTWQVLSALSQSLEHSLRRMSQDSAVLPRAMHCAF